MDHFLFVFVVFKHKFYKKNSRLQRDSNSYCQSRRLARWPLDHHGHRIVNLFIFATPADRIWTWDHLNWQNHSAHSVFACFSKKYLYPKGLILNLKLSNEWYNMMMLKINNTRSNKKTFTATEIDLFLSKNNQILLTRMY